MVYSKMAATNSGLDESSNDVSSKISPWARGDHLRNVEKEVLIPKIVREKAMVNCDDLVKGTFSLFKRTHILINFTATFRYSALSAFSQCAKKRTVSVVWACRKENQAMKDCLTS